MPPDNYSRIAQGVLEMSNLHLLPAILRMYYILSVIDKNYIANIGFKRKLLKIEIERMANSFVQESLFISILTAIHSMHDLLIQKSYNTNESFAENSFFGLDTGRIANRTFQENAVEMLLANRLHFLTSIMPYLRYDR